MRDVEAAQKAYEAVSQRLTQTRMESQSNQTNVSVLTAASPPIQPSSPKILLNTLIAIFLGTMLGVCAAVLRELSDRRVRSIDDLIALDARAGACRHRQSPSAASPAVPSQLIACRSLLNRCVMKPENIALYSASTAVARTQRSIGAILIDAGRLSMEDAERVLRVQREEKLLFGDAALKLKVLTQADIDFALSRQFNYEYLQRGSSQVSESVVAAYDPFSEEVEAFRTLRSQLMVRWFDGDPSRRVLGHREPRSQRGSQLRRGEPGSGVCPVRRTGPARGCRPSQSDATYPVRPGKSQRPFIGPVWPAGRSRVRGSSRPATSFHINSGPGAAKPDRASFKTRFYASAPGPERTIRRDRDRFAAGLAIHGCANDHNPAPAAP